MDSLKQEIAHTAARLIADAGLDYGSAKHKAAQEVWGTGHLPKNSLPSNEDLDLALLEHLELFDPDHGARVRHLREAALVVMDLLAAGLPDAEILLTGSAWKGVCAAHAHVHLQIFNDNPKEVEYALLNAKLQYTSETAAHWRGDREVEALALYLPQSYIQKALGRASLEPISEPISKRPTPIAVLLSLYGIDALRGALKSKIRLHEEMPARGNRHALQTLLGTQLHDGQ